MPARRVSVSAAMVRPRSMFEAWCAGVERAVGDPLEVVNRNGHLLPPCLLHLQAGAPVGCEGDGALNGGEERIRVQQRQRQGLHNRVLAGRRCRRRVDEAGLADIVLPCIHATRQKVTSRSAARRGSWPGRCSGRSGAPSRAGRRRDRRRLRRETHPSPSQSGTRRRASGRSRLAEARTC